MILHIFFGLSERLNHLLLSVNQNLKKNVYIYVKSIYQIIYLIMC